MRKVLPILSIFLIAITFQNVQAQKRTFAGAATNNMPGFNFIGLNEGCDSIGWPVPANQSVTWFTLPDNEGYISGNNRYGDVAKGNYFDLSASSANFVNRVIIGLGPVNGANGQNGAKPIKVHVLDGTSGTPGSIIGSFSATMENFKSLARSISLLTFSPAVPLPASKKIFLIVNFAGLDWNTTAIASSKDSLTLLSTNIGEVPLPIAWEQWIDSSWHNMDNAWASPTSTLKLNNHIYPLVSATSGGCTLPVTFGIFEGKETASGMELNWSTWTETNNERFEVERSADALKYVSIGRVATKAEQGNSQGYKSYSFVDANPSAGTNFYRIRQVDRDGASDLSKVIKLNYKGNGEFGFIKRYYPNPAQDRLIIQLANGVREVESLQFSDITGKVLTAIKPAVAADGTINVSVSAMRSGINMATLTLPNGQKTTLKVVKQ
jgi:hypothetical protein